MKKLFTFLCLLFMINKISAQCTANFVYTLNPGGNVTFSNTSAATSSNPTYYWNFGDYNSDTLVNASHTYAGNGIYYVTLQLNDSTSASCMSSITKTITITSASCLLSAGISTYQSTGGSVFFYDNSSGNLPSTTYTLNFGDNSTTNYIAAHTYSAAGNYTVTLTAANSPGCMSTFTTVLNVQILTCSVSANFNFSVNGGTVSFVNTTTGASALANYQWNFDNSNISNLQNPPPETYLYNGTYTVTLTVNDSSLFWCSSTITKTIAVTNAPCYANSSFVMSKDSTQVPSIVWNAIPNYPTNVVSAIWDWGDNSSSSGLYPSHTYSATGMYNICLTVSVSCGNTSTTCINSNIYKNANGESMAMASVHVINLAAGIKKQVPAKNVVTVFPNPNNGTFSIKDLNGEFDNAVIIDQLGKVVHICEDLANTKEIQMDTLLSKGVYFIRLNSNNGIITKKIVITK